MVLDRGGIGGDAEQAGPRLVMPVFVGDPRGALPLAPRSVAGRDRYSPSRATSSALGESVEAVGDDGKLFTFGVCSRVGVMAVLELEACRAKVASGSSTRPSTT